MIDNDNEFVTRLLGLGYIERYEPNADDCGGILCIVSKEPCVKEPSNLKTRFDHIRSYENGMFIGATGEEWPFVFLVDNDGNPVDASYYKKQIAELTEK